MKNVNNITACHLDHLDSLRKRHDYQLNSRVGCKVISGHGASARLQNVSERLHTTDPDKPQHLVAIPFVSSLNCCSHSQCGSDEKHVNSFAGILTLEYRLSLCHF